MVLCDSASRTIIAHALPYEGADVGWTRTCVCFHRRTLATKVVQMSVRIFLCRFECLGTGASGVPLFRVTPDKVHVPTNVLACSVKQIRTPLNTPIFRIQHARAIQRGRLAKSPTEKWRAHSIHLVVSRRFVARASP